MISSPEHARPFALDLDFEIITPLFMAGADQALPDLRAPSIRGAVRAWYRALDPEFRANEVLWFGAADQADDLGVKHTRQSPWLLRVLPPVPSGVFRLDRAAYARFDAGRPPNKTNGVLYTGFSLLDRFNLRSAFDASSQTRRSLFRLRLVVPRPVEGSDRAGGLSPRGLRAILGAFWLLGHLGGLGSRSRRGWGSVQLMGIRPAANQVLPPTFQTVVTSFAPASPVGATQWAADVSRVLRELRAEFKAPRTGDAGLPGHLSPDSSIRIFRKGHPEWAAALNQVGTKLQAFRRDQFEDRKMVADHLEHRMSRGTHGREMTTAPARVAFGLPLTFRFGITPARVKERVNGSLRPDTIEFVPGERVPGQPEKTLSRYPGPVSLRIVRLQTGWHAVAVRLSAAPVATPDPGKAVARTPVLGKVIDGKRESPPPAGPLRSPGESILDAWIQAITPDSMEARP